jgi:uroporphyrinogen decarboxylase
MPAPRAERFLRACRGEPADCTPIWIMRQAGRYLEEYRKLRRRHKFLEMVRDSSLAVEVTLMPIRRFELDAAILFSDILVPAWGIGVPFRIEDNVGPIIEAPLRTEDAIRKLRRFDPGRDVPFVLEATRSLSRELEGKVPLIGFSGAPFTLAGYLVEGKSSKNFRWTKGLMLGRPDLWKRLMDHLAGTVAAYLKAQVEAGADAVQIFDSWVGYLSPADYARSVLPHMRRLFGELGKLAVPVIHFGTDTATLLELMAEAGGDVIGVDWRIPLDEAWKRIGPKRGIQGNLDPAVLFADPDAVCREAKDILDRAAGRPGHIFNLGHGILPETPPENVARLVDFVHESTARSSRQA